VCNAQQTIAVIVIQVVPRQQDCVIKVIGIAVTWAVQITLVLTETRQCRYALGGHVQNAVPSVHKIVGLENSHLNNFDNQWDS
jgi:hypothetical protein